MPYCAWFRQRTERGREGQEIRVAGYNERMKNARRAKGLSFEAAAARASRLLLPSQEFTSSTARRTEQGAEEDADPIRVWALAQVFGQPLEDLSPIAAEWFSGVAGGPGQDLGNSAWSLTTQTVAA